MESTYTPEVETFDDGRVQVTFYLDINLVDPTKARDKANYEAARVIISPFRAGQKPTVEVVSKGHPLVGDDEKAMTTDYFKDEAFALSETALGKDWLRPEEDEAWRDL